MTRETEEPKEVLDESAPGDGQNPKPEQNATKGQEGQSPVEDRLPPTNFTSFVFSISTSILMDLGELENPSTKKKSQNPRLAKHSIDILAMLEEKTKGNLTDEESKLLTNVLADLRLRYIKVDSNEKKGPDQ